MCLSDHPDLNFMVWAALKHYRNLAALTGLSREDILHEIKTHIFLYGSHNIEGVSTTTIVYRCTKWGLLKYLRGNKPLKEKVSLEEIAHPSIGGSTDIDEFNSLIGSLSQNERTVLTMKFVGHKDFSEISSHLNLSKPRIEQIFKKALKSLKKELYEKDK